MQRTTVKFIDILVAVIVFILFGWIGALITMGVYIWAVLPKGFFKALFGHRP